MVSDVGNEVFRNPRSPFVGRREDVRRGYVGRIPNRVGPSRAESGRCQVEGLWVERFPRPWTRTVGGAGGGGRTPV